MNNLSLYPPQGVPNGGFCCLFGDMVYVLTAKEFRFTINNPASNKGAVLSRTNQRVSYNLVGEKKHEN